MCAVWSHTHTHTLEREKERGGRSPPPRDGEREKEVMFNTPSQTLQRKKIEREEAHFEIHFVSVRIKSCT